ncbi:hypothetical protein N7507_006954 [Penicillium longicatenatum]|nr:hypothetical protein N7507_006954 [Penicillium longicatenatum]
MAEFEEPQPSIRKHRIPFQVKSVALNFRDIAITTVKENIVSVDKCHMHCTTAWNALYRNNPLKPSQTVLSQGTGRVSITGLALAKATGFTTIITSSSDEKLEHSPKWVSEAQKIPGGQGVDYILENGGSGTIKLSLEAILFGRVIQSSAFSRLGLKTTCLISLRLLSPRLLLFEVSLSGRSSNWRRLSASSPGIQVHVPSRSGQSCLRAMSCDLPV